MKSAPLQGEIWTSTKHEQLPFAYGSLPLR